MIMKKMLKKNFQVGLKKFVKIREIRGFIYFNAFNLIERHQAVFSIIKSIIFVF